MRGVKTIAIESINSMFSNSDMFSLTVNDFSTMSIKLITLHFMHSFVIDDLYDGRLLIVYSTSLVIRHINCV